MASVSKDVDVKSRIRHLVAWGQRLSLDYQRSRASLAAGAPAYFVALSIAPAALAAHSAFTSPKALTKAKTRSLLYFRMVA